MQALYFLVDSVISLYIWILIIAIIMSWLINFGVINTHNPFVNNVYYMLRQLTEPALRPIRRFMPDLGGVDISPIILIIGLQFLEIFILRDILTPLMYG